MRPRTLVALATLVALFPSVAQHAAADAGVQPSSHTQSLLDGCQRDDAAQLSLSSPEWVYVNRAQVAAARVAGDQTAGRATVEGVVGDIHPAGDDLYVNHDYNDIDIDVKLDAPYAGYSATGNGSGEIGTEWEDALSPTWAWPAVGDRVRESGSWIWDCGHWGNSAADPTGLSQYIPYDPVETGSDLASGGGAIRGEQTELHPLYEIATWRLDAAGPLRTVKGARVLQQLDVWISGDGGPALSEEECALFGLPNGALFPQSCPRYRDVGGHYRYKLRLGDGSGRIVVNPVLVHPETTTPPQHLRIAPDYRAGTVTVSFDLPHAPEPQHLGLTVQAGWSNAPAAVHHVVTLDELDVHATLDGASEPNIDPVTDQARKAPGGEAAQEQTPGPGEWELFTQVSGHWWQVPPSLVGQVTAGEAIRLDHTFDFYLPQGIAPTLYVSGRECDIPLIDCRKDAYGAPPTDRAHAFGEVGFNDKPGRVELMNMGMPMQPGTSVYQPAVNPERWQTSEDLSDATCGGPCYSLTATART
jgi:hypothetical protein